MHTCCRRHAVRAVRLPAQCPCALRAPAKGKHAGKLDGGGSGGRQQAASAGRGSSGRQAGRAAGGMAAGTQLQRTSHQSCASMGCTCLGAQREAVRSWPPGPAFLASASSWRSHMRALDLPRQAGHSAAPSMLPIACSAQSAPQNKSATPCFSLCKAGGGPRPPACRPLASLAGGAAGEPMHAARERHVLVSHVPQPCASRQHTADPHRNPCCTHLQSASRAGLCATAPPFP